MSDVESRLLNVFAAVFPGRSPEKLRSASQINTEAWDSIAAVTLIGLIEEEFETSIDLDRMEELSSFQAICDLLKEVRH